MRDLAGVFLRIGNLTFGGGDPMVAALQRELIDRRGWLREEQYGLAYGLARVTPGTNVLAFSAAVAWMIRGWPGAVLAVVAVSLPSAVLAFLLTAGYGRVESIPWARAAMAGIAASVVGIMAAGSILLMRPQWKAGRHLRVVVLTGGALVCSHWLAWPPVPILMATAVVGYFWHE